MTEYIEFAVRMPIGEADRFIARFGKGNVRILGFLLGEEIVRCRDCKPYSEHEWIIATDVSDVCHLWHGKPTKVEPDGFCAWGERRGDA